MQLYFFKVFLLRCIYCVIGCGTVGVCTQYIPRGRLNIVSESDICLTSNSEIKLHFDEMMMATLC
jgi:hypothetical protein